MLKEIAGNILEFIQHLYQGMHESVEKDLEEGGWKQMAQNKIVLSLAGILILCIVIPMLFSSRVEMSYAKQAEESTIPHEVVKRVVLMDSVMSLTKPGEVRVKDIEIKSISPIQVDGKAASSVEYVMVLKVENKEKRRIKGSIVLRKNGNEWLRYSEATKTWSPT